TKSHPTTKRPKAVGAWVKNARKGTPEIVGAETIEREWWAWWGAINPGLRERDQDGKPIQQGEGSWSMLSCPGQNGFLNVIVCLKWWYGEMETVSDGWKLVVADVKWVLKGMLG
ncbi:hypothetical protein B0H13DRAFT_1649828, partial [Mycena leptocephala]